jgi:hypothetical protein
MANKDNLRYQIHFVVISKQKRIVEFFRMRWEQPTVQGLTICGGLMFTNDSTMVTMALPVVEFSRQGYKIGKVFA